MKAKAILLLALATVARGQKDCPNKSLFEPCLCGLTPFIAVACNNITGVDQLQRVVDNTLDYNFHDWFIVDSYIAYLNATWLAEKETMKLRIHNTRLVDMFGQTSTAMTVPSMVNFAIERSVILRGMRWTSFKPFVGMQSLSVISTEIKKLGKDFRDNVTPELKYLYMQDTKTSGLGESDFEGKRKLVTIQIARSGLKVLKNSFFKDQKASLLRMDFSYNPIELLPDDLFQGFQNLGAFVLNNSKVKTLSAGVLGLAPRSLILEINDNPLVCDCKMKWLATGRRFNSYLFGKCNSPPDLKSKNLVELDAGDFSLCR